MRFRYLLLCLLFLSLLAATSSRGAEPNDAPTFNPKTVLLSHFTLSRPSQWQWVQTGAHDGNIFTEVVFSAGDPQDPNNHALIFFNHAKPKAGIATREATAARWKTWFAQIHSTIPFSTEKIGENKVSYIEITGNFLGPQAGKKKIKPRNDVTLFGAHIEDEEGNIMIRLVGPRKMVDRTKSTLQEMIKEMVEK